MSTATRSENKARTHHYESLIKKFQKKLANQLGPCYVPIVADATRDDPPIRVAGVGKMKDLSKVVADQARELKAQAAQISALKASKNAAKIARSKNRYDAAIAEGLSELDAQIAATSTIDGTAKGAIAKWLLRRGPGEYTVAAIRKGTAKEFAATAAQVDAALAMLVKGFALRKLVGHTLAYDAVGETVVLEAREVRKAPRKVARPRKTKALPAPTGESEVA